MIPAAFDYVRAESAEEAISLVGQHGDEAKFIAGGHSLLPMMKLRLAQPSVLIDIGRLTDLSYIRDGGDHIAVGALTRHMDVETSALLQEHVPLLAHAAGQVVDVDQVLGVGEPQLHHGQQAVAAGHDPRLVPEPFQQRDGVIHARRPRVLDR